MLLRRTDRGEGGCFASPHFREAHKPKRGVSKPEPAPPDRRRAWRNCVRRPFRFARGIALKPIDACGYRGTECSRSCQYYAPTPLGSVQGGVALRFPPHSTTRACKRPGCKHSVFNVIAARTLVRWKVGWRRSLEICWRGSAVRVFLRDKSLAPAEFLVGALNASPGEGGTCDAPWRARATVFHPGPES